jgi:hypothetical protein
MPMSLSENSRPPNRSVPEPDAYASVMLTEALLLDAYDADDLSYCLYMIDAYDQSYCADAYDADDLSYCLYA